MSKRDVQILLDAEKRQRPINRPYGRIQWKGTNVCMDVYCSCGASYHIDGDFVYYVRCLACDKVFATGTNIELIEVPEPESSICTHSDHSQERVGRGA